MGRRGELAKRGDRGMKSGERKKEEQEEGGRGKKEGERKGERKERGKREKKRGERTGGIEEGRRGEEESRREERTLYDGVSYCQCNFEDCLLVQLMCQHVCLLHKAVGVQHSVDETLPILVLPLFLETVSMGVFVCECYGGGMHNSVTSFIRLTR